MKVLVHSVEEAKGSEYRLFAELVPCNHPEDYVKLVFSSQWTGAKNPEAEQTKFECFLSPDSVKNLQQLFEKQ